jgi:2-amino-4-hydroxy-6-hydroxymethyldihydropteridine diphosphokinase
VTRAYVGLGSNLGDREHNLREALRLLEAEPGVHVVAVSTLRETDPVGYLDQPRFLNAACAIETTLAPQELLTRLLAVERRLGRERTVPRYGPRTVDLDLLLYENQLIDEPGLTVPHPRLAERRFVLEPLAELDPTLVLPDGRGVSALLERSSAPAGLPPRGTMGSCPASTSSTSTKPSSSSA